MPENPPHPGKTCSACGASSVAVYSNYVKDMPPLQKASRCVPCVLGDPLFGTTTTCQFCSKFKLVLHGSKGNSCRSCTDGFPEKMAADTAAELKAVKNKAIIETVPRVEARLGQLEVNVTKQLDAVMALELSSGERMKGLEIKIGDAQSGIASVVDLQRDVVRMASECAKEDRVAKLEADVARLSDRMTEQNECMARQEKFIRARIAKQDEFMVHQAELAQARDANIQALLLRLISDAVVDKAKAEELARLKRDLGEQERACREKAQRLRRELEDDERVIDETRKRISELL